MRKYIILSLLCCLFTAARSQQYGLFNTKTLFDSFENPAQTSFTLDSSRQYATNFLIPYLDLSSFNRGNSDKATNSLLQRGYRSSRVGDFSDPEIMRENINIYLFNLRLFKYHKFHGEMGFSWQVKAETEVNYDEKLSRGLFDTFSVFATVPRVNIFNNNYKHQSYHQFSFNYRENYTKRLALGVKLSVLSGLGYTEFNATKSNVVLNPVTKSMQLEMDGTTRFHYPEKYIDASDFLPFKNLGASISVGSTYTAKSGVFLMGNIKDLGFIRWNKKSIQSTFSENGTWSNIKDHQSLRGAMENIGRNERISKAFVTPINTRADFLVSKTFGMYTPSLILSKNVFDKFGEVALVITLKYGLISISGTPSYNLDHKFRLGMQGMLQTPNFEMFLGTNDLMQTYYTGRELFSRNSAATGYNRGSVYLGMAFKIGCIVEHPMNMSCMPKVGDDKEREGIFKSIFGFFKKRNN